MMKRCSKCEHEKARTDFYASKVNQDGLQRWCKDCSAEACRRWKEENPGKSAECKRKWLQKNPGKNAEKCLMWRQKNPEKSAKLLRKSKQSYKGKAREILHNAVKRGKLIKPGACEHCQEPVEKHRLHGHHPDYSKPLEVIWLCFRCHGKEHRKYPEIDGEAAHAAG